jgi:hypothetical protein
MTRSFQLCSTVLAGALSLAAHAQETPAQAENKGVPPRVVKIKARTNPGDLPYEWVFNDQRLLQNRLPAQARMVDFSWRITFTELSLPEQDAWAPQGWAVALVGNGFEQAVPVERGGYFLLPALPQGHRGSTIMFREQSLPGHIGAAWRVRVRADQRLSYAGFKQAMDEVHTVQNAIPLDQPGLEQVRISHYDALKACFLAGGGRVVLDGLPVADAIVGNCVILKFDPARGASGQPIEFKGPLDVVTVVESADYATGPDLPALAGKQTATPAGDAGMVLDAASSEAPTNLSNLSYAWNFKRQLRLQGGPPAQSHLVDFVWRMSFDGVSEAEQDAWTPQGWALALAGKDFARAVPVARGGYFLLPALPPGRQDATLVFKEQGKRNLIGAAWVVRLRQGQRPYLHYGEIKEAMNAVRKAQESIPDGNAELAGLRAAHYDGLKACFLETDGVVFVGDMPTADATVGNCRVLKFDPAADINQKIEFVGQLDAVTVVDTAPYLQTKG